MLLENDQGDTNSIYPTELDISRIGAMKAGDFFDGEKGNFRVFYYKDGYTLLLTNNSSNKEFQHFSDKDNLIGFLKFSK